MDYNVGSAYKMSPETTAVGAVSSAVAVHVASRRWLFLRLGGFDAHFMKTSLILVLAFVFVGCESSRQSASLTADQAKTLAMRLANDNAATLYHSRPFVAGQPAQIVAGHWLWVARQGFGHGDIQAAVEVAMDGSTNHVDLQIFDSQAY